MALRKVDTEERRGMGVVLKQHVCPLGFGDLGGGGSKMSRLAERYSIAMEFFGNTVQWQFGETGAGTGAGDSLRFVYLFWLRNGALVFGCHVMC